eukprot:171418-Amorphochlora_amoeboformis.AAC.1
MATRLKVVDVSTLERWGGDSVPAGNHHGSPFPYNPKLNQKLILWRGDICDLNVGAVSTKIFGEIKQGFRWLLGEGYGTMGGTEVRSKPESATGQLIPYLYSSQPSCFHSYKPMLYSQACMQTN